MVFPVVSRLPTRFWALVIFTLIYTMLAASQMRLFFDEKGRLKRHGSDAGETAIPLWLAAFLLTINFARV
jgi:hypothetical protein